MALAWSIKGSWAILYENNLITKFRVGPEFRYVMYFRLTYYIKRFHLKIMKFRHSKAQYIIISYFYQKPKVKGRHVTFYSQKIWYEKNNGRHVTFYSQKITGILVCLSYAQNWEKIIINAKLMWFLFLAVLV